MRTTVQDGVTVVISKVVTEVGGTQTTVSRCRPCCGTVKVERLELKVADNLALGVQLS